MKRDKACLFALLSLAGILSLPVQAAGRDALATVQHKFDAVNQHDTDAIGRFYAPDAVLHSPDNPDLSGRAPIADTYRKLFAMIPDARARVVLLERAGDHVYAQFVMTGHFGGAQDKPVSVRLMSVYTMKNGHIAQDDTYYDRKM